jgi:Zn-dependent peptidase ImmA (M78 family)
MVDIMRTAAAIGTNPEILHWARKNSGYSIDEIAKKMKKDRDKIIFWENGKAVPTWKQLSKLSGIYRYPSAFFFGDEIPKDESIPSDFRTLPNRTLNHFPEIRFEIKNAAERREIALDIIKRLGDEIPEFTLKSSIDDDPEEIASKIREYLGISIEEQLKWHKDKYTAFNKWKNILEKKGVLIFQFTGIAVEEVRGYSLAKQPLPVIGINTADDPKARIFSMFHELTHIISGTSGVCDMRDRDQKIERFCDAVAAKFLVPPSVLLKNTLVKNHASLYWENDILSSLSSKFGVSKEVILITLVKSKRTTWEIYKEIKAGWHKDSSNSEPKIPYYIKVRSWNGNYYTDLLLNAYHKKLINRHDLSSYMGNVKLEHIARMEV